MASMVTQNKKEFTMEELMDEVVLAVSSSYDRKYFF